MELGWLTLYYFPNWSFGNKEFQPSFSSRRKQCSSEGKDEYANRKGSSGETGVTRYIDREARTNL